MVKDKLSRTLKEIKKAPYLSKEEQEQFLKELDSLAINEGDVGLLGRLNKSAFSVRKKNHKIPRQIKINFDTFKDSEVLEIIKKAAKDHPSSSDS